MSCGSPTGWSTRSGGESRTRPSATWGRKHDPLFRVRKLLVKGEERLDEMGRAKLLEALRVGDPHDELLGDTMAKESLRSVYLEPDPRAAAVLLDAVISGCRQDDVPEIRTLDRWREEILNHHRTDASNGPTEGPNFCAKLVKRAGRGITNFKHYRLRVLLYAGGVSWPTTIEAPRISSTRPR